MGEALDLARHLTPIRQSIYALEQQVLQIPQTECPVTNHFAPGVYVREMLIPAGTVITGKIHKTEHLSAILSGEISVLTDDGVKRMRAPAVFKSGAGIKRAGYAHTDTVFATIHATDETDLDKLEAELTYSAEEQAAMLAEAMQSLKELEA